MLYLWVKVPKIRDKAHINIKVDIEYNIGRHYGYCIVQSVILVGGNGCFELFSVEIVVDPDAVISLFMVSWVSFCSFIIASFIMVVVISFTCVYSCVWSMLTCLLFTLFIWLFFGFDYFTYCLLLVLDF